MTHGKKPDDEKSRIVYIETRPVEDDPRNNPIATVRILSEEEAEETRRKSQRVENKPAYDFGPKPLFPPVKHKP